jgi:hypothetical protein
MSRQRPNAPDSGRPRRARAGAPADGARTRPRTAAEVAELSDEELRALLDENVDPDEVARVAGEADDEQEASDHDRDTTRDRLESLLLAQEDF